MIMMKKKTKKKKKKKNKNKKKKKKKKKKRENIEALYERLKILTSKKGTVFGQKRVLRLVPLFFLFFINMFLPTSTFKLNLFEYFLD